MPFVDCLTTILDETLPLTITEWEEWGDPLHDPAVYAYMKAYSPYDNVEAKDYPALFISGGLNDPRVQYWEPAKWVAKLRATKTDDRLLVLKMEMGAGHSGPVGPLRRLEGRGVRARLRARPARDRRLIRSGPTTQEAGPEGPATCAFEPRVQTGRTFCASSPFRPGATSNSTRWPSSRVL